MKIGFYGAAGEVTGSCFLLEVGGERLLIDCGMFQGEGSEERNYDKLGFDPGSLTGVVLTHAHLDHCGRLPLLVKDSKGRSGYRDRIYATAPTIELTEIVLRDAARIAKGEWEKGNRKRVIYRMREVDRVLELINSVEYGEEFRVGRSFGVKLLDAGHILGSASVEITELQSGKVVVFSGDLGNEPSLIVRKTQTPVRAEAVVLESTYGNRLHPAKGEEMEKLASLCRRVEETKGTLLLPAFSIERTQELLFLFDQMKKQSKVSQELRVYLDSPMSLKVTAVFEKYAAYFNEAMREHFRRDDPFDFPGLVLVEKKRESRMISEDRGAKVIIAGSGMMSGGRIMFHAKRWLAEEETILLITGFQAVGTLGRELLEGVKEVVIEGEKVTVRARVEEITTMSAHADQRQLLEWLGRVEGRRQVVLVHGEEEGREGLAVKIGVGVKVWRPKQGEKINLGVS